MLTECCVATRGEAKRYLSIAECAVAPATASRECTTVG